MRKFIKPKNKVFCRGCNKTKILFATKEKADNFLKFNREYFLEKDGNALNHSYFCRFCMGYHVTSNSLKRAKMIYAERDKKEITDMIDAVKRNDRYLKGKKVIRKKEDNTD